MRKPHSLGEYSKHVCPVTPYQPMGNKKIYSVQLSSINITKNYFLLLKNPYNCNFRAPLLTKRAVLQAIIALDIDEIEAIS
jgi:hypothetical protein